MKKISVFCLVVCISFSAFSQGSKVANNLLWRITGNGLSQPSYLYGTMHLTDKRVFQLGDSVFKALEKTEGFAAELDMNSIGIKMLNRMMKDNEEKAAKEPPAIKEVLDAETWNRYKDELEKKIGKKAEKITVDDLDIIESKLDLDLFKKGDMPTFLDAWLYGQARKQGKWVGGIEDLEDQFEVIESDEVEKKIQMALFDDNYYRGGLESFIKIYTNQQLDSIDAFMYREQNGKKDHILIKRNLKMARRMDSLSAVRTTLFAVGAAHLPGDSGVITLLRNRGFTVEPVISAKKVDAKKYVAKTVAFPWVPVTVKDNSYALEMPGAAELIDLFEEMGLEINSFFDIAFMKMYMTMAVDLPEARKNLGEDSLFKLVKKRYEAEGTTSTDKLITINGINGHEFSISMPQGELRMQLFLPEMKKMILNAVFAFSEKTLNESESDKFFQSFTYKGSPSKPTKEETVWNRMEVPAQAFSIEVPKKMKETKDVLSEEGKTIYNWQAVDMMSQIFYGIRVSALKHGMYVSIDDTAYFEGIKNDLKEKFANASVIDSSFITMNKYPGYRLTIGGDMQGENLETTILAVSRGGLSYYLFVVYNPAFESKSSAERFLHSFNLLPYQHTEWKTQTAPDGSFRYVSPVAIKAKELLEEDDIHPGSTRYIAYDAAAGVSMYFDKSILPDWFWYSSDTAFLRKRALEYVSWGDSLQDFSVAVSGAVKTASFTVARPGSHVYKKVKLIVNGNELFELFGHFASVDLPDLYNRFFDDFELLQEKKSVDFSVSKITELVSAITTNDKQSTASIKNWWDYLRFTQSDVPELQKMFFKIYQDFDSNYYGNLNKFILDKITELDSSHTTIDYIRKNYASIQPENEFVKAFVVNYLSGIKTAESYTLLKECLTGFPINLGKLNYLPHSFYDSLSLSATLFPELLKLSGTESLWRMVSNTAVTLIDSNLLDSKMVKAYAEPIVGLAKQMLDKEKTDIEESSYLYTDFIRLLGYVNTPSANSLLSRFAKFSNNEIKFVTLIAMLENNRPVNQLTTLSMASTDEYRHRLFDELKRINKLNLFPPAFLTQKELGKSKLFEYISSEDYEVNILKFIAEKTVVYKGSKQKFYLFKVSFTDDETTFLGVAGPFALHPKEFTSTHAVTGIDWEGTFDIKNLDQLLSEYLANFEQDEARENEN